MRIVHNTSVYGVLELIKDEIEDIEYDLDLALDCLNEALETSDDDDKWRFILKAIDHVKEAKDKIYIKWG